MPRIPQSLVHAFLAVQALARRQSVAQTTRLSVDFPSGCPKNVENVICGRFSMVTDQHCSASPEFKGKGPFLVIAFIFGKLLLVHKRYLGFHCSLKTRSDRKSISNSISLFFITCFNRLDTFSAKRKTSVLS